MPVTLGGLGALTLVREPVLVLVPPEHPLRARQELRLREVADEDFVCMRSGYGLRELSDRLCAEAGFRPRVVIETGQLSIVHGMVRSGIGLALLPRLAASGASCVRALADRGAHRELGAVWRRSALVSPPVRTFLDLLVESTAGSSTA